jgi:hypothetical protein
MTSTRHLTALACGVIALAALVPVPTAGALATHHTHHTHVVMHASVAMHAPVHLGSVSILPNSSWHPRVRDVVSSAETHTPHAFSPRDNTSAYNVCTTNPCPATNAQLADEGGPLKSRASVWFLTFSDQPTSLSPSTGYIPGTLAVTEPSAAGATNAVLDSAYFTSWATEYSRMATNQMLLPGSYAGTVNVYNPTLADAAIVDNATISAALQDAQTAGILPAFGANAIFVLWFRAGQEITVNAQSINSLHDFCAYHSFVPVYAPSAPGNTQDLDYIVMPNESAVAGCAFAGTPFGAMTTALSHELAETVTDPGDGPAWTSPLTGDEVADLCNAGTSTPITSLTGFTYQVAYLFAQTWGLNTTDGRNAQIWGCYAQRTSVVLSATYDPSSTPGMTSMVHVKLTGPSGPLVGQWISVINTKGVDSTTATQASGTADINIVTDQPVSDLGVLYYGTSQYAPSYTQLALVPATPTLNAPTITGTSATFTWTDPAGSTPDYHSVILSNAQSCTTSLNSCTFTNLNPALDYTATLAAYATTTASATSSVSFAFPVPPSPSPATVTASTTALTTTWTNPPVGYTQLIASASPSSYSCTATVPATSCTISGLSPATTYTVSAYTVNVYGSSSPLTITTTTSSSAPPPPTALRLVPTSGQVIATWTAPVINGGSVVTSYTATASPGGATCTTATTSCTVTGLTNGTTYTISVIATSASGDSPPVTALTTPSSPPGPPLALAVTPSHATLTTAWAPPADNGGSRVTSYVATLNPGARVCHTASTGCAFTGLVDFASYSLSVVAVNATGASAPARVANLSPHVPFALHIGTAALAFAGAPVTITVSTAPAVPGRVVTISAPGLGVRVATNARGRAAVTYTPPAARAIQSVTATLTNVSSTTIFHVHYAFAGFFTPSLRAHTGAVLFSLTSPAHAVTASSLDALVNAHLAAVSVSSSSATTIAVCTTVHGPWIVCPVSLPASAVTIQALTGGAGQWYAPNVYHDGSPATVIGETMLPGTALGVGQALYASNGAFTASLTSSGQVTINDATGTVVRTLGRATSAPAQMVLTLSGLVEILDTSGHIVSSSHTASPSATLTLTNAGNLELHAANGTLVWTSARQDLS